MAPETFGVVSDAEGRATHANRECLAMSCDCEDSCGGQCQMSDLVKLIERATDNSKLVNSPIHGWKHWMSVYRNAIMIAEIAGLHRFDPSENPDSTQLDFTAIAILFALFHDCRRTTEGHDIVHGAFGSIAMTSTLMNTDGLTPLLPEWSIASYACTLHTIVDHPSRCEEFKAIESIDASCISSDDIKSAIGMCLDADRLDLLRLGIVPEDRFLTHTEAVKRAGEVLWKNEVYGQHE